MKVRFYLVPLAIFLCATSARADANRGDCYKAQQNEFMACEVNNFQPQNFKALVKSCQDADSKCNRVCDSASKAYKNTGDDDLAKDVENAKFYCEMRMRSMEDSKSQPELTDAEARGALLLTTVLSLGAGPIPAIFSAR